jgi:methyl-accepting chemotaxis protein
MFSQIHRGSQSIKTRGIGILGLLAVGYLLLLGMIQLAASATHANMDRASSSLFPAALQVQEAEASFNQMKVSYLDAVLVEETSDLDSADRHGSDVETALTKLRASVADSPKLSETTDDLLNRVAGIRSRSRSTYGAMLKSKGIVSDEVLAQAGSLAKDDLALAADMKSLDAQIANEFRSDLAQVDDWSIRSRNMGWAMTMAAIVGCIGGWWVLQHKVLKPLESLSRRMRDIAEGDGDLTGRVEVLGENELDEVGRWFNLFIERVEMIVVRVTGNALALADAARGLATIARETASHSAMQQDQAASITGSMDEISTAAVAISQSTQKAAQDARIAEQKAQAGGDTIRATVATIQELLAANQATAKKIAELGDASDAIGKIIGVIEDIANQTSLLALNAAIESARAGEHGRGFAVVATEVRRLAERTGKATQEINRTVRAIQSGTAEVIGAMQASMLQVASGVSSARSAGNMLESIIRGSEEVQRMVTQIASAASQQSFSTQSVKANLNKIAGIIEQTNGSSAGAVAACDRLSNLAADLNGLVGRFKVRAAISAIPIRIEEADRAAGPLSRFNSSSYQNNATGYATLTPVSAKS